MYVQTSTFYIVNTILLLVPIKTLMDEQMGRFYFIHMYVCMGVVVAWFDGMR